MRHQKAGKKFSRTSSHRKAMFSNMIASLVLHGRIETTDTKAKELKRFADRTISWGTSVSDLILKGRDKLDAPEKARVVHAMRMAGRVLRQPEALDKLFKEVAPRFKDRPGGYTRVMKTRIRLGDAVSMSFVELVDNPATAAPAATPDPDQKAEKKAKKKETKAESKPASAAPAKKSKSK